MWIDNEFIDNYTDKSAICDNCLTHVGLHKISFLVKDGVLYINFWKQVGNIRPNGETDDKVYYLISVGSYVQAKRVD